VVARYIHDEHSEVRAQAVSALRRVQTPEAQAQLKRASEEDPDEKVRESAKWALSYHQ
jgi:HEAT repeat protein